jgi:hypothetical protein
MSDCQSRSFVGDAVGVLVGEGVGPNEGLDVGLSVGSFVGDAVGVLVGKAWEPTRAWMLAYRLDPLLVMQLESYVGGSS